MKIATQFLSSTPNVSAKIASPLGCGADFHGAFNAAAGSNEKARAKTSSQAQTAKPQATEPQKKHTVSDSSGSGSGAFLFPTSKPVTKDAGFVFPVAVEDPAQVASQVISQTASQNASQNVSAYQIAVGPVGETGLSASSLASVSSSIQLPTNVRSAHVGDPKAADPAQLLPLPPAKLSETATASVTPKGVANPKLSLPDLRTAASIPVAATPATKASALTTSPVDSPKLGDAPNSVSVASATDPASLAAQQAASTANQNAAPSASPPSLGIADGIQPASAIAASKATNTGGAAERLKEAASRQTVSPSKLKQASSFPEMRGKDGSTQVASAPPTSASFVKIVEGTGAASLATSESKSASDSGSIQQIAQTSTPAGSNHLAPAPQSFAAPADPAARTAPGQAPLDGQAMQGVTTAQLTQSVRSSEMRLGMHSAEFGDISISTSLNHQALSAQISIGHSELGRALAVHLPAIEEKLGSAYGVQAKVELRESNNPSSSNNSGYTNTGQQSREQRQSERGGSAATQGATFEGIVNRSGFTPASVTASASRLDIRI